VVFENLTPIPNTMMTSSLFCTITLCNESCYLYAAIKGAI